jgi:hypothetical protein
MKNNLTEGEDYYFNEDGNIVFTAQYLLKRGECCGSGCRHCPFDYINVANSEVRTSLIAKRNSSKEKSE